jgi:Leu/Phe-tRNA-protein transferase
MKAGIKTATPTALPRTTCSAVVTRYPTGCFGIDYQGSMFFWWGFGENNVHAELERLRIPAKRVKWEERYYDRRYDFNDPRSYKTRKFIPLNAESIHPETKPNDHE